MVPESALTFYSMYVEFFGVVDFGVLNHLKATIVKLLSCIKIGTFICFSNDEKKGKSTLSITISITKHNISVVLGSIWSGCADGVILL